jgi:xylobiose transport system substrate-binding protein
MDNFNIPQISRRSLLAGIAGIGALGALGACGGKTPSGPGGGGGGGGGGQAEIWTLDEAALVPSQQQAIDRFNAMPDVKFKMKLVAIPTAGTSMNDKVRTAMNTPNRPGIFFNWGGGSIREYATNDLLVDFTSAFDKDAEWKAKWLPSVLAAGGIDGKPYGIPLRGMQPVVLYYNKSLFEKNNVQPPKTWDDLMNLVKTFKSKGIIPFVLGGADSWTELMWLEYLVDRIGSPTVFENIAKGTDGAWGDPAIKEALTRIVELVDAGAFGEKYSSVAYGNHAASTLFAQGKGAMHLMGTWEFTGQVAAAPDFAKKDLGFANFPQLPGGKGDPKNVVGNPTNYFSVTQGDWSDDCVKFLHQMTDDTYVGQLIKAGEIPAISGIESKLEDSPDPRFAKAIYSMVQTAPTFTLSWDQAFDSATAEKMNTNLQQVFNKQITPDKFVTIMNGK